MTIVYGNTRAELEKVQPGGTFFLAGQWDCSVEGPMYIPYPIHITGDGGMKIRGYSGMSQFGDGSRIKNDHATAQEAIFIDTPKTNESQGLRIEKIGIRHAGKTSDAIRLRNAPGSCLEHIYVDNRYGRGGLFYDEGCFFMEARHVIIRDFDRIGVNIAGNGNGYSFYDCTVAARRRSYEVANTAEAAIHCINSGLQVIGGYYEAQNDARTGVGIRLFYDHAKRPACEGDALIYGPYTENGDIAIQVDATEGYKWDKARIISPHFGLRRHREFTRGVEVVRGSNICVEHIQLTEWAEAGPDVIVFRENASNCTFVGDGQYCTDYGTGNRVMAA